MRLAMIGLGRMGGNMVQRLVEGGHQVVAYDRNPDAVVRAVALGAEAAESLDEAAAKLTPPRVAWVMVPAGRPTEETIGSLREVLTAGDVVVDGGNSNYKDSMRRAGELAGEGIGFVDAGTSGGIWGLKVGYCLMVGGRAEDVALAEPAFRTLAPPEGYAHVGPSGAGHFAKMVHNGVEYALLQAYGEGFEILKASEFDVDLRQIAALWNRGSVVRSWLLELAEQAFDKEPDLGSIQGYVEDSGEGRWTVYDAIEQAVPAPVITLSLLERFRSRQEELFSAKFVAALRDEFGGHGVRRFDA